MPVHGDFSATPVPTGSWGGNGLRLDVTEAGATVEYNCAFGEINEPLFADAQGNFVGHGAHVFERGGPQLRHQPPLEQHVATYRGWTDGSRMQLTVTLVDAGDELGPFELRLGHPAHLVKCL